MKDGLIRLRFPITVAGEREDVARLRAILNARGYDAAPADIQAAWELHSDRDWAAGWMGFDHMPEYVVADALLGYLVPIDGEEA